MSNPTPNQELSSDDDSYEMIDVSIVKNGVEAMTLEEEMEIVTHSDVEDPEQRNAANTDNISNKAIVQSEDDQPSTSSSFVGVSMKKTKKERRTFGPPPISKKAKDRRLRWETLSEDKKATFTEEASRLRLPIRAVANDPEELPCNTSSCPTFSSHEIAIKERKLKAKPWIDNFLKERKMEEKRKEKSYKKRIIINLNKKYKKTLTSYHLSSTSESNDSDDYNGEPSSSGQMSTEEAVARSQLMMAGWSMYDRVKGRRSGSKLKKNRIKNDEEIRKEALELIRRRKEIERLEAEREMNEILERKKMDMKQKAAAMAHAMLSHQQQQKQQLQQRQLQQELQQQLMLQQQQQGSSEQQVLPHQLMQQVMTRLPASTPKAQVQKLISQMQQGLQLQQGTAAEGRSHPQQSARSADFTPQQQHSVTAQISSAATSGSEPQDFYQQQLLLQTDIMQQIRTQLQQTGTLQPPSRQLQQQLQQLKTVTPYVPDGQANVQPNTDTRRQRESILLQEMLGTSPPHVQQLIASMLQNVQHTPQLEAQCAELPRMQQQLATDAQNMQAKQLLTSRLTRTELQELVLQLLAMHPDNIEQTQAQQQQVVVESEEQQQMNNVAKDAATAAIALVENPTGPGMGAVGAAVEAAVYVFEVNRHVEPHANEPMSSQFATSKTEELFRHLKLLKSEQQRAQQQPGSSALTHQQQPALSQQHLNRCLQIADSMQQVESFKQRTELLITEASDMTPEQNHQQAQQLRQEMLQQSQQLIQLLMGMTSVGTEETRVQQLIGQFGQELMQQQGATTLQGLSQVLQQVQDGILSQSPQVWDSMTQLESVKQLLGLLDSAQQQPGPSHSTPRYSFP